MWKNVIMKLQIKIILLIIKIEKNPCDSVNPHKSIKNNKSDHCEICDMPFSRSDSLERHCKKFHPELVQKNKQKNIQTITGIKIYQINNNPQINGNKQ